MTETETGHAAAAVNGSGPLPDAPAVAPATGGERVMALVMLAGAGMLVALALDLFGVPVFDWLGGLVPRPVAGHDGD
jgi:hypothetical protein